MNGADSGSTVWRSIFQATWKTHKYRFGTLTDNIRGHGALLQSQATLAQIEEFRRTREAEDQKLNQMLEAQETQRLRDLYSWMQSPTVENDQRHFAGIRNETPSSGRWILDDTSFKEWCDPNFPTIPALLWINGIPGAGGSTRTAISAFGTELINDLGKTILASLIIDEIGKMDLRPDLLYFYCKQDNNDKNNFVSLARSFLCQLLRTNKSTLLPYYYEEFSKSSECVLNNMNTIEGLLNVALLNCPNVYIIIDGIDECPRAERKHISKWFRDIVESLQPPRQDRVRCLFVSQDDGVARKDFADITTISIQKKNTQLDIKEYSQIFAGQLPAEMPVATRELIAIKIQETADGMLKICYHILVRGDWLIT